MVVMIQDLAHLATYEHVSLDPDLLPTQELACLCAQEIAQYRVGEMSDERYGRALFYRAISMRDEEAWTCIYQQYTPLLLTWVSNHPQAIYVLEYDNYDSVVNAAFARFSQALTPAKFDSFPSVAALLQYLKQCVRTAIIDLLRAQRNRQMETVLDLAELEPPGNDPADYVVGQLEMGDVWQEIQHTLRSEKERVCATLLYVDGLDAHEIQRRHRRLFPTVAEVYRVKYNLLARLRRNRLLRGMWMRSQ